MDEEKFTCILFCPVCCSTLDVEGEGNKKFSCTNCETSFAVEIRREVVANYSLH